MASKKIMKSSAELDLMILEMKEQLKKLKKEQKIRERQETAERARLERQKQVEEALALIEIAKQSTVNSVNMYDWLIAENSRRKNSKLEEKPPVQLVPSA